MQSSFDDKIYPTCEEDFVYPCEEDLVYPCEEDLVYPDEAREFMSAIEVMEEKRQKFERRKGIKKVSKV